MKNVYYLRRQSLFSLFVYWFVMWPALGGCSKCCTPSVRSVHPIFSRPY